MGDPVLNTSQAQAVDEVHLPHPPENVAIWCQDLAFRYREAEVFSNVSFHVHRGEFVALTGKNGAGKSTLLKLIVGLLELKNDFSTLPEYKWLQDNASRYGFRQSYTSENFKKTGIQVEPLALEIQLSIRRCKSLKSSTSHIH